MLDAQSREPVSTYGDALSWLFKHSDVAEWAFEPDAHFPREAILICDMFWVSHTKLVKDLRKLWEGSSRVAAAHPPRRFQRNAGWR